MRTSHQERSVAINRVEAPERQTWIQYSSDSIFQAAPIETIAKSGDQLPVYRPMTKVNIHPAPIPTSTIGRNNNSRRRSNNPYRTQWKIIIGKHKRWLPTNPSKAPGTSKR